MADLVDALIFTSHKLSFFVKGSLLEKERDLGGAVQEVLSGVEVTGPVHGFLLLLGRENANRFGIEALDERLRSFSQLEHFLLRCKVFQREKAILLVGQLQRTLSLCL